MNVVFTTFDGTFHRSEHSVHHLFCLWVSGAVGQSWVSHQQQKFNYLISRWSLFLPCAHFCYYYHCSYDQLTTCTSAAHMCVINKVTSSIRWSIVLLSPCFWLAASPAFGLTCFLRCFDHLQLWAQWAVICIKDFLRLSCTDHFFLTSPARNYMQFSWSPSSCLLATSWLL